MDEHQDDRSETRWFAVVNPTAGRRTIDIDRLRKGATSAGVQLVLQITASTSEAHEAVTRAVREGFDHFVAVGGDGTAHTIVNALMPLRSDGRCFVLGLVASGSGSDLVRTFGHNRDLDEGFRRLAIPDRYPIDVGVVRLPDRSVYFLNAANIGVAAVSARAAERLPRRLGGLRYIVAFWWSLARYRVGSLDVAVDHHRFAGEATNVVIANGQFFGGGMNIAPRASTNDGLFDVQVFSGPKRHAFTVMPRLLVGTHLTHRAVHRYIGSRVVVDAAAATPVEADGEVIGATPVTIELIPGAVDLVV
ncbi:MAG: YegS/Rv2252/BmrU family lipid kinase [Acidimicrobiia bacterium]